jgi:hypothetical protein
MGNDMKRVRTIIEYAALSALAAISIIIASLDLIGLLDASNWLAQRIPALTLLGIGFVAGYLILERRGTLDQIAISLEQHHQEILQTVTSSSSRTIRSLKGVEARTFNDGASFISYFAERTRQAHRVDDISWGTPVPPSSAREKEVYDSYYQVIAEVASKPDVIWREVVMFIQKSRFDRIKPLLLAGIPGYSAAYYDAVSKEAPPRMTFAIVDGEEVFLASYGLRVAVRHPDIVEYFSQYYEDIWKNGNTLKIGSQVDMEAVRRLEASLR